jgi:processive 1,2-diacylglycerol beta-glucosyltransferase
MSFRHHRSSLRVRAEGPTRVLVLSADVGEGHAAAARALRQQLNADPRESEVTVIDGLRAMGRVLQPVVEDGYRVQLRVMPWSYTLTYWMLEHIWPVRMYARMLLCLFGSRPLARTIDRHDPDIIVSTYPAVTVVLARLRRRGRVRATVMATITDMTGLFFWAQPGVDMHLVMYPESLDDVERIAGADSVRLVRPLIASEFLEARCPQATRELLGLPAGDRVIVVSGGGWGVGDLAGAVGELRAMPQSTIVCLAGRNDHAREELERRFGQADNVHVWGFTDQMPQLLAAADVLVHSTGGVTCLEAMATGTPIISYGLPVGHAKINTQAMARAHLLDLADDLDELLELVTARIPPVADAPPPVLALPDGAAVGELSPTVSARVLDTAAGPGPMRELQACDVVLEARRRVRPIPAWKLRVVRTLAQVSLVAVAGAWTLSTGEVTALAAAVLHATPVRTVHTNQPKVALILEVPPAAEARIAATLAQQGLHPTFAATTIPSPATVRAVHTLGDEGLPVAADAHFFHWMKTGGLLRHQARLFGLAHHFFFLEPPGGLTVGQLVLSRTAGARGIAGEERFASTAALPAITPKPGDVLVVTANDSRRSLHGVQRIVSWLGRHRLGAESFEDLLGRQ